MLELQLKPCRYPVGELNGGAFLTIGRITVAIPPDARFVTLTIPNPSDRTVREIHLRVHRKNPRLQQLADNDNDVAFLGVGDRAEVIDHPAFEPLEGLEPTKPRCEN